MKLKSIIPKTFILISFFILIQFNNLKAQYGATAYSSITSNIIIPVIAEENTQLNFGKFYFTDKGSIKISPNGLVTTTSGIVMYNSYRSAGSFIVSGQNNSTINITLPTSTIIKNNSFNSLIIDNWTTNVDTTNVTLTNGAETILIGATLNGNSIEENSKGIYSGTYEITFSYN